MQRNHFMTIVSNPQLITLQSFSMHHPWVNRQRNPRSHVIVLKDLTANQITTSFKYT